MTLLPPPGGTRLVSRSGESAIITANRETDARTALTRGLAEYLEQLVFDGNYGRQQAFKRVFSSWAEQEDEADYPSATVYAQGQGTYDKSRFNVSASHKNRVEQPDGRYLVSPSEYVIDLFLDVWATDPEQRMALTAMLEDALSPLEYTYGLVLELPHYFNERATYELMTGGYIDDEAASQQRVRRAQFILTGRVAVQRLVELPTAVLRTNVKVEESREC